MKRQLSIQSILLIIVLLISFTIVIGTIGFRYISKLEWIDALHNSALYLSGAGPTFELKTKEEKLFSTFYAVVGSILFLAIIIFMVDQVLQFEIFHR